MGGDAANVPRRRRDNRVTSDARGHDEDVPVRSLDAARELEGSTAGASGPGESGRRRALRNSAANAASRIVSIGSSFVVTPIILHVTGPTAFGLWVLIGSVVAYGSLLDLGIGGALTKYVAEYRATSQPGMARRAISTGIRLYLVLGAIVAVVGVLLAPVIAVLLGVPTEQRALAVATTGLMSIGLGIAIPATTASAVLRGLQRHDLAAAISIVGSVASLVATLAALAVGWGIVGIVGLGLPIPILTQGLALLAIRRIAPELLTGPRDESSGWRRRILGFSWPLFVLDIAGRLQSKSDEIVVGVALSLGAVAPYSLGRKLASIPRLVAEQFAMLLLPWASDLHARNDSARLQGLYLAGVRISLAIAVPLTGCLGLLAVPILRVWVGPGFDEGGPVVIALVVAALVDLSLWPAGFVLQGMARHRWLGPISLASGLANLGLSLALAAPLGIVGVAIGTLVPTVIEAVVLLTPYTLRALRIPVGRFLRDAVGPALLPALPMLAVVWLAERLLAPTSIAAVVGLVALAHVVYGLGYLRFPVAAPERASLRDLGRSIAAVRSAGRSRERSAERHRPG